MQAMHGSKLIMRLYYTLLLWAWIGVWKGTSQEIRPRILFVAPGENATLTCFDSTGAVEWLRGPVLGNLTAVDASREVLSSEGSVLTVTDVSENVLPRDYYCRETAPYVGSTLSCPSTLSLAVIASKFEVEPSDVGAEVGSDAFIPCVPPTSQPPAVVTWTRDGHTLSSENSSHVVVGPWGLVLTNVSVDDGGVYQCEAFNHVTQERRYSREAHFNVTAQAYEGRGLGTPSIMVAPPNATAVEGGTVTFQCVVAGCPVSWTGPQGTLPSSAKVTPGGVLTLENVSPLDEGQYVCSSSCHMSVLTATAAVHVQVSPKVTLQPSNMMLVRKGDQLSCTVTGTGQIRVYLLLSGIVLTSLERFVESTLILTYSLKESSGLYQCMAISSHGCGHTESFIVTLPPTLATPTTPAPTITPLNISVTPSNNVTISAGDSVKLVCTAVGGVVPTLVWSDVTSGYTLLTSDSLDTLSNNAARATIVVKTSGRYSCLAIAGTSTGAVETTVIVLDPSIVAAVHSVDGEEGATVRLACTISDCSPIRVEWSKGLIPIPFTMRGDVTNLTLGPVSVRDAGNYTCSVVCSNGMTVADQMVVKVTTLWPPPQPPSHVTALWTNGSVEVTWEAPPHPAYLSPILGYKLNWEGEGRPLPLSGVTSVPADKHSVTIATLSVLGSYNIAVWAYSRGGDGPMGVVTLQPLVTNPFMITECTHTSSNTANVKWEAFDTVMKDTRLVYSCGSAHVTQSVGVASPGMTHLIQLLPNCSYDVWLQVNGKDESRCTFTTPPGPLNITATIFNGAIQLQWSLPEGAKVELYLEDHWVDVTLGGVVASFGRLHEVVVMVTISSWTATSVIALPTEATPTNSPIFTASPSPVMISSDEDGVNGNKLGVLYGIIFGSLLAACSIALSLILVLKYVQMSRMKQDKETGTKVQRYEQTEAFRRMSISRSSSTSLGKIPPSPYITVEHRSPDTHAGTSCIQYLGETSGSITVDTSSRHSTITSTSLKMTPPPDHNMSDDVGSVGAGSYIVIIRKPRKDVIVTDI